MQRRRDAANGFVRGGAGALALAAPGRADDAPPEHTGIKVGEKAPEFTLTDQAGKRRSLGEFLKNGPVALVFFRSANW